MKYLFVILMTFAALTGCEKAKTPKQVEEERWLKSKSVYYACVNNNLENKDYSARAKAHCRDLEREAASKY